MDTGTRVQGSTGMYTVARKIDEGGFGEVFEVHHENGAVCALKLLKTVNAANKDEIVKRFAREVRIQRRLSHPNVAEIYDSDLKSAPPWFTMPLAAATFADLIADKVTNKDNIEQGLLSILTGLEEIHRLGFKHRDLKPQNVLVIRNAEGALEYKISDFGLVSANESQMSSMTDTGMGAGSQKYAPPECIDNFKRASVESDIYSFGAILHDVYTDGKRTPYTQLDGPGEVGAIIRKCTERVAIRRYRSVAALKSDLYDAIILGDIELTSTAARQALAPLDEDVANITDEQWDDIYLYYEGETDPVQLLESFKVLEMRHIQALKGYDPQISASLGRIYADHVIGASFSFDYCDVLGVKLEEFFGVGDVETQAKCLLAMLVLGTSHNRWFVERIFTRLAGESLDSNVAQRFLIEAELEGVNLHDQIVHLARSISYDSSLLHPAIQTGALP